MDSSFWFDTISLGWSTVYLGMSDYYLKKTHCFFGLKIFFALTNSVDTDEMLHGYFSVKVPVFWGWFNLTIFTYIP